MSILIFNVTSKIRAVSMIVLRDIGVIVLHARLIFVSLTNE